MGDLYDIGKEGIDMCNVEVDKVVKKMKECYLALEKCTDDEIFPNITKFKTKVKIQFHYANLKVFMEVFNKLNRKMATNL